jgi:hypothetical protein
MELKNQSYDANFTAGGLLLNEFKVMSEMLLSDDFLNSLREEEETNKTIGIATMSARKRIIAEVKRRYTIAPKGFWHQFVQWNENEMKFGLLFLCFKAYPLILDIHIEVALKKFRTGNSLNAYDVQMRLDEIASKDEFVAKWSNQTLDKLNVQYRKAIKDVGIYDGINLIIPHRISSTFWQYFEDIDESWFLTACFLKN